MKESEPSAVKAWVQTVTIPTYPVPPADRNPMFLDRRVYQGSSGKVYPNPFTDRVSDKRADKEYRAVFLENDFLHVMILPEIGGRIHVGQDRTNGYDFFYHQNVIKPALVGLLGPWISGGVEFNWAQHHRPSTFMPVDYLVEEHEDGSRTVWLGEHEPMNRMKGMVGICVYPGKALIETKVRLFNRTPFVQTFLWWANAGIRVHDQYQAFFPPDVHFVADHAKRAMSWYPVARNFYYGVDYTAGVDIAWYKNIPVPTSYMVTKSEYDFLGGYDHAAQAGVVHVANHHIAPGKKLWTWGNAEFGYAWDRELTDADGPYIELMAGVFTDNQPDFSWLQPYETKTFSQYWYPIQRIGPAKNANRLLAVNLEPQGSDWTVGVCATEEIENVRVVITLAGHVVFEELGSIRPGAPWSAKFTLAVACHSELLLQILAADGQELIRYQPEKRGIDELPPPATEPLSPEAIPTADELYLTGLHLEQYHHASGHPESYWREALQRDPGDARCNNAMGRLLLRRGQLLQAEEHFRKAINRLTHRNPNPEDGEVFYSLGLALKFQSRHEEAYSSFYKALWSRAWKSPAAYELATIACLHGDLPLAERHLGECIETDSANLKARNLKTAVLRRAGMRKESQSLAHQTLKMDPLDFWSRYELVLLAVAGQTERRASAFFRLINGNVQTCLDLAWDYADAGMWGEAIELLQRYLDATDHGHPHPMVLYSQSYFAELRGDPESAARFRSRARLASTDYCFPARLEEMIALECALRKNPDDAQAHYYLGNLLYDKERRVEAITHWERSTQLDPSFSIPWRNLGIACFNVLGETERALKCYQMAQEANPDDARLLYEFDQLRKRSGASPDDRLTLLQQRRELVDRRDDLTVELVTLYNQIGRADEALSILSSRRFHPWEGGEGLVSGQYVASHVLLGRKALAASDAQTALRHFQAARSYPHNLGEGKHLLTEERHLDYHEGVALAQQGDADEARQRWEAAAASNNWNALTYYRALALRSLGREREATTVLTELRAFAERQMKAPVKIDYFATSLPNFLLFEDDLEKRNRIECLFLRGMASKGLGHDREAADDLRALLELDRNHLWASVELSEIAACRDEAERVETPK